MTRLTAARVPWSWAALAVSALPIGVVMTMMFFVTAAFRTGLDADMNMMLAASPLSMIAIAVPEAGLFGVIFVLLGRLLANRTARPRRWFLILVPVVPPGLFFGLKVVFGLPGYLSTPDSIVRFEQDELLYLPNWLEVGFTALAFVLAAHAYLTVAQAVALEKPAKPTAPLHR